VADQLAVTGAAAGHGRQRPQPDRRARICGADGGAPAWPANPAAVGGHGRRRAVHRAPGGAPQRLAANMQAYGPAFARAYQLRWGGFARQVTPRLIDFYAHTPAGQARQPVLDLCCGTGLAALGFLEAGYQVTGLDLSPHMLAYARQNTAAHTGWHARRPA